MAQLAALGAEPVFRQPLEWRPFWPPRDESTAKKLLDLYMSGQWTAFDELEPAFCDAFAKHHDTRYGVFMVNGTVTLQCALAASGIGPGDEVIVPALTWYATAMAAHYLRAIPVFVDIDPDTLCIDPDCIAEAITERTKAIIPVHLYGSMADMDRINTIARQRGLKVIEDCAHAHGGIWNGTHIGSLGDVGSFSFQHSKTMASAEGGICITSDADLFEKIFRMKHIGYGPGQLPGKATSGPPPGLLCYPFRATAFQALILNEQLQSLDDRLARYEAGARYLEERLSQTTQIRFQKRGLKADRQSYFGWVMIFDDPIYRDIPLSVIQRALTAEGLPVMMTWDPVYRFILFNLHPSAYRIHRLCTVTEGIGTRVLWLLHAYLGLPRNQLESIATAIEKVLCNLPELLKYGASLPAPAK